MSFSTYYIEKMLQNNTINTCEKDQLVETLYNLLKNAHVSKQMIYRDFTWNTSLGIIDKIKILKYNKETGFELKFTKPLPKEKNCKETNSTNSTIDEIVSTKKKVSIRTIINKESEKIINEELLYFILKRLSIDNEKTNSKENKDDFAERIKLKLKIKKLTVNDKLKIYNKYDEIYEVIKSNKA